MGFFADWRKEKTEKRKLRLARIENQIAETEARTIAINTRKRMIEQFTNTGYSHGGASTSETWAEEYHSESLSPKSDIEMNRKILRERTRDLSMNAPLATAAINSTRTSCVGSGLVPKPKIDYEFLGIGREEAFELQQTIRKEFALWAESTLCDTSDLNNFYELQQIIFGDWLKNGEEFILIRYENKLPYMPYQLRLKLILADRVSTPDSTDGGYDGFDRELENGNSVMNGVEINPDGRVEAYYICSNFPGEYSAKKAEWTRVRKRGKYTGNPNILHVFNAETAEQYRGVPFLAPVIHAIKQLTRYTDAEIMAALVNSLFALFIRTESGEEVGGFGGVDEDDEDDEWEKMMKNAHKDEDRIRLGTGIINFLKQNESVEAVESKHPAGNYDAFIQSMSNQIGAALEISPEVLFKKFTNNFSASKGALNETWKSISMRRKWFINDFCQEVYELWFAEAVSKGRIHAPGFFTDPLIRKAYTNATWTGPAQGCLNPLQEVSAAVARIENGLSTHEDECAAINGSDFEDNVRTLKNENEKLAEARRHADESEEKDNAEKN